MNPIETETVSPETAPPQTEDPVPMNPIESQAPSEIEGDLVEPTDTLVDEEPSLPEDTPADETGGSETQSDNSTSAAVSASRFAFALATTLLLPFLV